MSGTIAEKILTRVSGKEEVNAGDFIDANVDLAMSHDNALLVLKIFKEIDRKKVWNPQKIAIVLDHRSPANSIKTADNQNLIREFVRNQKDRIFWYSGVQWFYNGGILEGSGCNCL